MLLLIFPTQNHIAHEHKKFPRSQLDQQRVSSQEEENEAQTEKSISSEDEHDHQKICSSVLHERSRTTHPNKLSLQKPRETQKIFKHPATLGNIYQ